MPVLRATRQGVMVLRLMVSAHIGVEILPLMDINKIRTSNGSMPGEVKSDTFSPSLLVWLLELHFLLEYSHVRMSRITGHAKWPEWLIGRTLRRTVRTKGTKVNMRDNHFVATTPNTTTQPTPQPQTLPAAAEIMGIRKGQHTIKPRKAVTTSSATCL